MNGFRFATVRRAKLLTMLSSASKMAGTENRIGLGKPFVCLLHKEALSGMLRKRGGSGRKLKSEWEIRKVLQKHFRLSADPIPFVEGTGYQARFKISCGPSFHT